MAQATPQNKQDSQRAWGVVEKQHMAEEILGAKAAQTVLTLSARASHHELPFGLSLMSGLVACTGGACVEVFPGSVNPLMLSVINVNYP